MSTAGAGNTRRYADAALAALVVLIVGMMIVPLPTGLLDVLLASNVAVAVLMMLVAMYVSDGLQFTAFPTILLITTLYRLALNVSSTRLILLQADAGDVIRSFGDFVVQGNYVVGAVVFLILTLIQFLVVAKGSERVAEVGARFTLDAMPGKQMSIDAELRAGALTQEEAGSKRRALQRESQFYGAMDGAMKFVKGDAIAGLVITVINIVGGLAIGVTMRGMGAVDALKTYGLLTIGDGLVSQIPALLISTSAGLLVTRVASETDDSSLGGDIASQIFGNPKALGIAALFLVALALVPGLPVAPFLILAVVFGTVAYRLSAAAKREVRPVQEVVQQEEASREIEARKERVPLLVPIKVLCDPSMGDEVVDAAGGGAFLETQVPELRDLLFRELGLPLPGVFSFQQSLGEEGAFSIELHEVPVLSAHIPSGLVFSDVPAHTLREAGISYTPVNALPAIFPIFGIPESEAKTAEAHGLPIFGAEGVLKRCLERAVRNRAEDFVGFQEVQTMLDQLERAYPAVVKSVVPKPVSLPLLTQVLKRLLAEGVSVRPMREILEALGTVAASEKDPLRLAEHVRAALGRQITLSHSHGHPLPYVLLDNEIVEAIEGEFVNTQTGRVFTMKPADRNAIIEAIARELELHDASTIVVTRPSIRATVSRLLRDRLRGVGVMTMGELDRDAQLSRVGIVRM